jgi:phospholipid/cholesterol/gamma-HCH transport system substrate-binding protein
MRVKNEVTVGLMVLAGFALLVFGAFWLSGRPWGQEQQEVVAIFRSVGELRQGNPVKYRGVQVGRVTNIELAARGEGVLVEMQIRPDLDLGPNTGVVLGPASLFGDWQANLLGIEEMPHMEFTTAQRGGILPGATMPDITELTAVGARIADDLQTLSERVQLAFTEETALDLRRTIENVGDMSQTLTGFVQQQTGAYADVSRNVLAATQNIQQATQVVTGVAEHVGAEVSVIVANARTASQNLEELSRRLESATVGIPAMVSRADTTLANFGRLAVSADVLLQTLEPQVAEVGPTLVEARQAMAFLQATMSQFQTGGGTLNRLLEDPALYEEMQAAIATLRRMMSDVQANPGRYISQIRIF